MVCLRAEGKWYALDDDVPYVMPWSRTRMVCLKTEGGCEREVCLGVGQG